MKKCSNRYSVGPSAISRSPALTRWLESSSFRPCTSMTSAAPAGAARRSTAWMRASSSRGEKGLVM